MISSRGTPDAHCRHDTGVPAALLLNSSLLHLFNIQPPDNSSSVAQTLPLPLCQTANESFVTLN